MALFLPRGRPRPPQPARILVLQQDAEGCPQPACRHPSHGGVPVPSRYCGTSQLQGLTVHHVRCALNPLHHQQFVKVGRRWQRIRT